jgi:hypothetical protein
MEISQHSVDHAKRRRPRQNKEVGFPAPRRDATFLGCTAFEHARRRRAHCDDPAATRPCRLDRHRRFHRQFELLGMKTPQTESRFVEGSKRARAHMQHDFGDFNTFRSKRLQ